MRITMLCVAFAFGLSSVPGAAQTNSTPVNNKPDLTHALALRLFQAGRASHQRDRTPQEKAQEAAALDKINDLTQAGTEALHNKNFVAAEEDYRELVQDRTLGPFPYYGLGEALTGEGKTAEALAVYKTAVYWPLNTGPEGAAFSRAIGNPFNLRGCSFLVDAVAWMKYALLLSQNGQNSEAFSVYSQASHLATDTAHPDVKISFSAGSPSPVELQAAAHIALGLLVNDTGNDREQAMSEFSQARTLAPDAAVTNYYYGYGWKRLDLKSPTRAANALQAKAALAKAVALDDGSIKKAAEKEGVRL